MKKTKCCQMAFVLTVFIIIYFFSYYFIDATFFDRHNIESYKDDVMLQTLSLAVIFVLLAFLYTFYRLSNRFGKKNSSYDHAKILEENERLKKAVTIDLLTNVYNKKYFDERFTQEFKRAIRDKETISLIIVDIDEFSSFEDIYLEEESNSCLKQIAQVLVKQCNRPCDLVARIDKDVFCVLLPNTNDAKTVSQRCVNSVEQLQIPHENSIASNVLTISVGTATILPQNSEEQSVLFNQAKKSLEEAKKQGRNRVF